jgi:hypothetical protein
MPYPDHQFGDAHPQIPNWFVAKPLQILSEKRKPVSLMPQSLSPDLQLDRKKPTWETKANFKYCKHCNPERDLISCLQRRQAHLVKKVSQNNLWYQIVLPETNLILQNDKPK